MKCKEFNRKIHEFIDACLPANEMALMEAHRGVCRACSERFQDFLFVRRVIAEKVVLPEVSARSILAKSLEGNRFFLFNWFSQLRTRVVDYWRGFEPRVFVARASALPISILFLVFLFGNLAPIRVERLAYLVVSTPLWTTESSAVPVVLNVQVVQRRGELSDLIDTAWRLPYEDSLAVVAEIKPEGHAEINSILEFPKSYALLNAVGSTLRESRFEKVGQLASPFVIYSFQKIDVYGQRGL